MTIQTQDQDPASNKEINFRRQEQAIKEKYEAMLAQERAEKEQLKAQMQSTMSDDEDEPEPYVDKKRLKKELAHFGQQTQKQTQSEIQNAVQAALKEERKSNWLRQNPDFAQVLEHAQKLAEKDPDLAESILEMPESFERQKLVYKNIKAMGLHKPAAKEPSIQDKIEQNRKTPYFQPSNMGSGGYTNQGDFSPAGQKAAYEKLQELKNNLRLG